MTPFAIKDGSTIYIVDPTQIRWLEYDQRHNDLTLYYHNGAMETITHEKIRSVYNDLLLQFNVLDVNKYGMEVYFLAARRVIRTTLVSDREALQAATELLVYLRNCQTDYNKFRASLLSAEDLD